MKKNICVVPGCDSTDTLNDSLKFHQIPKDAELRKKWLKAINRTEPEINKRSRVCSKHFKNQDYAVTRFNYTMGGKNTASGSEFKALKNEAVPNQHLPQKSTFKIKISKKDSGKQIKVEEVKVKEEKPDKYEKAERSEKVRMPKRSAAEMSPPRSRTQSRRAASKEALKQMQLLLDDENDAVEIPDDDYFLDIIPIDPSPPPPPKKKYKLSHRKSSDGNDRDVIVLKTITNRDAENTLELDCWVEELEEAQKNRNKKLKEEEKELQDKLDSLISQCSGKVIHKGDLGTIIEVSEQVQSAIQGSKAPPTSLILNNNLGGQQSYQLVMDPRMGLVVGALSPQPSTTQPKAYQGKVQVAQNLQQSPSTPTNTTPARTNTRTRNRGSNKITPPPPAVTQTRTPVTQTRAQSTPQTRAQVTPQTRAQVTPQTRTQVTPQTRTQVTPQTRTQVTPQTRTQVTPQTRTQATPQTRTQVTPTRTQITPTKTQVAPQTRTQVTPQTRTQVAPQTRTQVTTQTRAQAAAPQTRGQAVAQTRSGLGKKQVAPPAVTTRGRAPQPQPPTNTFTTSVRPDETNVQGGLATGGKKVVVDLTADDNNKSAPDSREIAFNKLQGKTYPSLVVVARPHLRVQDLAVDRPKLDAKVKSVLMHVPTKFTEWLIQQGLVRSEQKCSVHTNTQLKLGMYSDVSKFPYSGGYVWISECCPQRFVSVFSGSLFEGSPHPPMVILKLLYHWSCQTNIQNVTQWVKVDNLYVKGMFTWLRSICTVALHTHIRQIGGPGIKVEVGVISLGTTSQDGNQRQVKVEVLGVLESESKLIRLRAVEPQAEGDRNYKKRFSKILEPVSRWVHPQSILVADLTVDKQTLISMGFQNVVQYSSNQYGNNNQIMEYLRRIVPRMFQNTLSLLSRQIIQQFLDELVWREWFGTSSLQAFDNLVMHLSEQTRFDSGQSLIVRLNKVAQNPFKSWAVTVGNSTKVVENTPTNANTNKKQRNARKPDPPKVPQTVPQENRPPKSTSPDVPEHMVPLESYYYGTLDTYSKTPKITLNMKCPFCKSMFDNNIQLMSHLFKHAHNVSMDAQLCRYCLTSVATANDLLKHIASSHPAETKFDNGFCCLICETQYMNPFVLGKHMSKEHYPSELPYKCGTCSYRCSNHKQAIDHFYKTHNNGPTIQCPFCLKSTTVFTASRNIVQNMNYFIQHLQKHQRKQFARRCGKCNLWFVQKDILKDHQNKMHVSQRGKNGLVPWTAPRNGIMVPKSKMDKYPVDAEVINFATLKFDLSKGLMCKECNTPMDTPKHFPSFESCQNPNCQYSTCCTNAMQEHNAKCNKTSNPVSEEKLPFEMFCICGHSDKDGNQMARHLAICERKSAYPSKTGAKGATVTHSMLDVLGLVRKAEEKPKQKSKKMKRDVSFDSADKPILDDLSIKKIDDKEILGNKTKKNIEKNTGDVEIVKDKSKNVEESTKDVEMTEGKSKNIQDVEIIEDTDENKNNKENTEDVTMIEGTNKDEKVEEAEDVLKVSETKEDLIDKPVEEDNNRDIGKNKEDEATSSNKDFLEAEQLKKSAQSDLEEHQTDAPQEKDKELSQIEESELAEPTTQEDTIKSKLLEDNLTQLEDLEDTNTEEEQTQSKNLEVPLQPENLLEIQEGLSQSETQDELSQSVMQKEPSQSEDFEDNQDSLEETVKKVSAGDYEKNQNESSESQNLEDDLKESSAKPSQDDLEKTDEESSHSKNLEETQEQPSPTESSPQLEDTHPEELEEKLPQSDDSHSEDYEEKQEKENEAKQLQPEDSKNKDDEVAESEKESEPQPEDSQDKEYETEVPEKEFEPQPEDSQEKEYDVETPEKELEPQTEDSQDKEYEVETPEKELEPQPEDSQDREYEVETPEKELEPQPEDSQDKEYDVEKPEKELELQPEDSQDKEYEVKEPEEELEAEPEDSQEKAYELEKPEKEPELQPEDYEVEEPEDLEDNKEPDLPEEELKSSGKIVEGSDIIPEDYQRELQNHTMETSEITQEKEPAITSDDIHNLLSDVVGESDGTSVMETDGDGKQMDDVNMASPSEMMEVPDAGEGPTPMETD